MHLSDIAEDLPRYRDWSPTQFDSKGLALPDRQDWIVCPCSQTRDSEPLDESNFAAAQRILDAAGVAYEVHRFGHWGPGWVEIIIVHPDGAECVAGIASRLASYPVLDESDYSDRETEAECEAWESYGRDEFVRVLAKEHGLQADTVDWLKYDGRAYAGLYQLYGETCREHCDFSHSPGMERGELASLIRQWRREVKP